MRPQRFGPEWWALYAATWAQLRTSSTTLRLQQADKTYSEEAVMPQDIARRCMHEADVALAAFVDVAPP